MNASKATEGAAAKRHLKRIDCGTFRVKQHFANFCESLHNSENSYEADHKVKLIRAQGECLGTRSR